MITIYYLVFIYFLLSVAYVLLFSVAGIWKRPSTSTSKESMKKSIAVLIPAYKEDGIIVDTALHALNQDYPNNCFTVVIIADSLKPKTLAALKQLPVRTVEVSFEKSTKAKALNEAMSKLPDHDLAVVLDADNLMARDFLQQVNEGSKRGFLALQGHRVAKNQNTPMAILDAISEEINNRIFRRGHRNLGLSSALIGSGMAFDYSLFKEKMRNIDALGGFDKALELALLKEKIQIEYLDNALIYDEKVSTSEVFTNQRTRWIAAQIRYGLSSISNASVQLLTRGKTDYFDKSLQFLLPPRLMALGALVLLSVVFTLFSIPLAVPYYILTTVYIGGLLLATPRHFWNNKTLKALMILPATFILMIKATLGFQKANKNFLHTPHQSLS